MSFIYISGIKCFECATTDATCADPFEASKLTSTDCSSTGKNKCLVGNYINQIILLRLL